MRILIADKHQIFREGLRRLLESYPDLEVVADVSNGPQVIRALSTAPVDCAILDHQLENNDGIALIEAVKRNQPKVKVLVVAGESGDFSAARALRAGADGYMTKDGTSEQLVAALRHIAQGSRYLCPTIAADLAMSISPGDGYREPHESLTDREFKIFYMLVAGKRGAQIASELDLSEKTVSTHKMHVLRKLHLQSSADLVHYAIRHNLTPA